MLICGISDLHGNLNFDIKECDVLCICGDVVPLNVQSYHKGTVKWLKKDFIPWLDKQPCKQVLLIGGNHDIIFQEYEREIRNLFNGTKITYLKDESVTIDEKVFYGTPWCHQFGNWAFMTTDEALANIYSNMPNDVDVLMTHDCSYGACDLLLQKLDWTPKEHIGNEPLAAAVVEKKPKYQLSGHLHSGNHEFEHFHETDCCNVSMVDENYDLVYEPKYFEI